MNERILTCAVIHFGGFAIDREQLSIAFDSTIGDVKSLPQQKNQIPSLQFVVAQSLYNLSRRLGLSGQNTHDSFGIASRKGVTEFLALCIHKGHAYAGTVRGNVAGIPTWELLANTVSTPIAQTTNLFNDFDCLNKRAVDGALSAAGGVAKVEF